MDDSVKNPIRRCLDGFRIQVKLPLSEDPGNRSADLGKVRRLSPVESNRHRGETLRHPVGFRIRGLFPPGACQYLGASLYWAASLYWDVSLCWDVIPYSVDCLNWAALPWAD